jgi:hypothetical protein
VYSDSGSAGGLVVFVVADLDDDGGVADVDGVGCLSGVSGSTMSGVDRAFCPIDSRAFPLPFLSGSAIL